MLVEVLFEAQQVSAAISKALLEPCRADDYAKFLLAEPLVIAAVQLLEWKMTEVGAPLSGGAERGLGDRPVATPTLARCLRSCRMLERAWPTPAVAQAAVLLEAAWMALAT